METFWLLFLKQPAREIQHIFNFRHEIKLQGPWKHVQGYFFTILVILGAKKISRKGPLGGGGVQKKSVTFVTLGPDPLPPPIFFKSVTKKNFRPNIGPKRGPKMTRCLPNFDFFFKVWHLVGADPPPPPKCDKCHTFFFFEPLPYLCEIVFDKKIKNNSFFHLWGGG